MSDATNGNIGSPAPENKTRAGSRQTARKRLGGHPRTFECYLGATRIVKQRKGGDLRVRPIDREMMLAPPTTSLALITDQRAVEFMRAFPPRQATGTGPISPGRGTSNEFCENTTMSMFKKMPQAAAPGLGNVMFNRVGVQKRCAVLIPIQGDQKLSAGQDHPPESWPWLEKALGEQGRKVVAEPGLYKGYWLDQETGKVICDLSRRYLFSLKGGDRKQLMAVLADACRVFSQNCIYVCDGRKAGLVSLQREVFPGGTNWEYQSIGIEHRLYLPKHASKRALLRAQDQRINQLVDRFQGLTIVPGLRQARCWCPNTATPISITGMEYRLAVPKERTEELEAAVANLGLQFVVDSEPSSDAQTSIAA
jgi:hypothetical protein